MKKLILFIFILNAFSFLYAQKVQKADIKCQVSLTPLIIISKSHLVDVEISSNYQNRIDDANAKIQAIRDEKTSRTNTEKVARVIMGSGSGPDPDDIFVPTLIGEESVPYINIPGYTEDNTATAKIKLVFSGVDFGTESSAELPYKPAKANVTIFNDKGEKCFDGILADVQAFSVYKRGTYEKLKVSYQKGEEKGKADAFKMINDYLAKNYGYYDYKGERRFYDVQDKKQTYPEYHAAIENVRSFFAYISVPSKKATGEKALKEAIATWEEALKELDKTAKDARINKEIGAITYLNLAEAYIWLNEFDKAREAVAEYKLLSNSYKNGEVIVTSFLNDYQKRYEAFLKY